MSSSVKHFVRNNRLIVAISLFIIMFSFIHFSKPGMIYNEEGGFRPFGVGYRHKTVFPIWIIAIVLAILSYLAVQYILL